MNHCLIDNSIKCLVPGLCGSGTKDNLNGYMFTLSFHIISRYEVRVYLNIDGFVTRFYIQDLLDFVPQFFEPNQSKLLNQLLSSRSYESISFFNKLKKCKNILSDSKFDEFYKLILQK